MAAIKGLPLPPPERIARLEAAGRFRILHFSLSLSLSLSLPSHFSSLLRNSLNLSICLLSFALFCRASSLALSGRPHPRARDRPPSAEALPSLWSPTLAAGRVGAAGGLRLRFGSRATRVMSFPRAAVKRCHFEDTALVGKGSVLAAVLVT